jgi:hypothetical protein
MMDDPKSHREPEQELLALRHSLRQEKLKKADQLLAHRLAYSAIIFVILFLILCNALDDANSLVQWLWIIVFFGAALFVLGRIGVHYLREKKEAEK